MAIQETHPSARPVVTIRCPHCNAPFNGEQDDLVMRHPWAVCLHCKALLRLEEGGALRLATAAEEAEAMPLVILGVAMAAAEPKPDDP